ncbi:MAG TPA: hypothetical protein PL053_03185 [Deltaproteobacteria bacterium]|nr:hypothetical protein [Deltaproteobacteria bacterium]
MLQNIRIGTRLTFGFLLVALITFAIGLFGYLQVNGLSEKNALLF